MRFVRVREGHRRKGVSPVIAEVLLIVVSLIAGVALGGFAFAIMGAYNHPAEVVAQVMSCAPSSGPSETCMINLTNLGSSTVGTTSCSVIVNGSNLIGTLTSKGIVPAGGTLTSVSCTAYGASGAEGSAIVGSILLSNGASVLFAGTSS